MADPRAEAIMRKLQDDGGRVTRPRRMILDVMLAAEDFHLNAAEIVAAVHQLDPSVAESTVYRTLTKLEQLGVVAPLSPAGATTYRVARSGHLHAVCERCGTVVEQSVELLADVAAALAEHGFTLDAERTTLTGSCRACTASGR